ncbi:MAG: S41 family peptidase [Clostridia bacterium]|nr:S41 family peptidase [Clostridia bacterium]
MRKKELSLEEQVKKYKRRSWILSAVLFFFISITGYYIYLNYDYLAFKHFIAQHYIYTNTLDELYKKEINLDVKGKYYSNFDDLVISVVTKRIRELNKDRYTYLFIPEQLEKYKAEEKEEASRSEVKSLTDQIVYLHLTNFSEYTRKFVFDHLDLLKKHPNIIIDFRDNPGGDIFAMNKLASLFIPKGSTITTDKLRIMDWTYKSRKAPILSYNKIFILQNKNSASASECFIGALKDNLKNVTLVGEPTYGKGIGQYTMPLKRGYAVKATTMLWYTPSGYNVQGKGIPPDITYTAEDIIDFSIKAIQK